MWGSRFIMLLINAFSRWKSIYILIYIFLYKILFLVYKFPMHWNVFIIAYSLTREEMSYTHAYDIMDPVPGSEWKVHVLKTPWKPPASFSWPSSTHNKKGREETRYLNFEACLTEKNKCRRILTFLSVLNHLIKFHTAQKLCKLIVTLVCLMITVTYKRI